MTDKDLEDDFGFSLISEEELNAGVQDVTDKLHGLRKMVMPLLNNLMKNPDKEYIFWPDRVKKIQAFIKKMDAYIEQ
jgi:hypothetical protein